MEEEELRQETDDGGKQGQLEAYNEDRAKVVYQVDTAQVESEHLVSLSFP